MGYRDNFYRVQNIVGYSGDIDNFPTVYFQTPWERGHITQAHDAIQNVGRHEVKSGVGYTIGNEDVGGGDIRLVEKINGEVFHTSRSTFTPVTNQNRGTLAQAITNYPAVKYITTYNPEIRDAIGAAANAKGIAMAELLAVRPPVQ